MCSVENNEDRIETKTTNNQNDARLEQAVDRVLQVYLFRYIRDNLTNCDFSRPILLACPLLLRTMDQSLLILTMFLFNLMFNTM